MPKFIPYDYNQNTMVVINYADQLQRGTFEFALHHLITHRLDLSAFLPKIKNDGTGRPAYDPAISLKIILFAYSKGITSSREIEWCCQYNIIFKALSCDTVPHFTTIAAFVSGHSQEMGDLFEKVLLVIESRYRRLGIDEDIYVKGTVVTADTGFANEANMQYLHNHGINGYIPDNRFRSRDPKFPGQKIKHGKRHQDTKKGTRNVIPASEFHLDPARRMCICPAGNQISFRREGTTDIGKRKLFFEGRLGQNR